METLEEVALYIEDLAAELCREYTDAVYDELCAAESWYEIVSKSLELGGCEVAA